MASSSFEKARAAQYVRMSTEHQQYSTHNQADKIREYAERRNLEIVRTYADEGKSGLSIGGRAALQRLISDVESSVADFTVILVYDVSRWGRFQDADESAFYEYICKRNGIQVAYCAEQFENDGSPVSTIVKGVKRAMAGEYSRELSAKVFAGQCRLIEMGYRQGGVAGYGLRRVLIDQAGNIKSVLAAGEHKSLQTDRVILMPGPEDEVQTVNQMFRWVIDEDLRLFEIAERLNGMGRYHEPDGRWTGSRVRGVLTNEKYIGNNVFNRRSFKLKRVRVNNPPEMWIRREGAFEGIVSPEIFFTVQNILAERSRRYTDEEILERIRALLHEHGRLSGLIISSCPDVPDSKQISKRFGGLGRLYEQVGYKPDRDVQYLEINRQLRRMHPELIDRTAQKIAEIGGVIRKDPKTEMLHLNEELAISLVLARAQKDGEGMLRWQVRLDPAYFAADITVAIRMDAMNERELDYLLLPGLAFASKTLRLSMRNVAEFEAFRFDNLDFFYEMGRRHSISRYQG